jgi:hypothetical protein
VEVITSTPRFVNAANLEIPVLKFNLPPRMRLSSVCLMPKLPLMDMGESAYVAPYRATEGAMTSVSTANTSTPKLVRPSGRNDLAEMAVAAGSQGSVPQEPVLCTPKAPSSAGSPDPDASKRRVQLACSS